jgi:hypothetical protein
MLGWVAEANVQTWWCRGASMILEHIRFPFGADEPPDVTPFQSLKCESSEVWLIRHLW